MSRTIPPHTGRRNSPRRSSLVKVHDAKNNEVHDVQNNARQGCERARVGERPVSSVCARQRGGELAVSREPAVSCYDMRAVARSFDLLAKPPL
jgi:hypothetical protein